MAPSGKSKSAFALTADAVDKSVPRTLLLDDKFSAYMAAHYVAMSNPQGALFMEMTLNSMSNLTEQQAYDFLVRFCPDFKVSKIYRDGRAIKR